MLYPWQSMDLQYCKPSWLMKKCKFAQMNWLFLNLDNLYKIHYYICTKWNSNKGKISKDWDISFLIHPQILVLHQILNILNLGSMGAWGYNNRCWVICNYPNVIVIYMCIFLEKCIITYISFPKKSEKNSWFRNQIRIELTVKPQRSHPSSRNSEHSWDSQPEVVSESWQ